MACHRVAQQKVTSTPSRPDNVTYAYMSGRFEPAQVNEMSQPMPDAPVSRSIPISRTSEAVAPMRSALSRNGKSAHKAIQRSACEGVEPNTRAVSPQARPTE